MKIFSSFDTKLDEKILKEALTQEWQAFMIKRHKLYLLYMFIWVFLAVIDSILIGIVLYFMLPLWLLIIIILLYILWMGIWIILSIVQLKEYLKKYEFIRTTISEEELKDWLLEKFLKFSIWLFFYQILLSIWTTIIWFLYNQIPGLNGILLNLWQLLLSLLFIYFVYKSLYVIVNFEMDFSVITPTKITSYNQTGLFKRESKTVWVDKIKTIQSNKKGIIRSLFDFGEIIILTEWDEKNNWEIKLKFIAQPDVIKNKITNFVNLSSEK